jgi:hypothetical protein
VEKGELLKEQKNGETEEIPKPNTMSINREELERETAMINDPVTREAATRLSTMMADIAEGQEVKEGEASRLEMSVFIGNGTEALLHGKLSPEGAANMIYNTLVNFIPKAMRMEMLGEVIIHLMEEGEMDEPFASHAHFTPPKGDIVN